MKKRIIPCLLINNGNLVKTVNFKNPTYVGDPINTVKIFNEKEVDEIIVLDISKNRHENGPNLDLLEEICSECFMPISYGGGIRSFEDAQKIFSCGVEKIVINKMAFFKPEDVKKISDFYGNQAVISSIDIKKNWFGKNKIMINSGKKTLNKDLKSYITEVEKMGAGEIFINSIDKDGTMTGYDANLFNEILSYTNLPVIGCGGAQSIEDILVTFKKTNISALAAGSFFVFQGKHKAVLITYPFSEDTNFSKGF